MNSLYIDCTGGISGDMVLNALRQLGGDTAAAEELTFSHQQEDEHNAHGHADHDHTGHGHVDHDHAGHGHAGGHTHRSYAEIKTIIAESSLSPQAKETALSIYAVIAAAEARVHGTDVEHVHFHEVGRDEAVRNMIGIAAALDSLPVDRICCSDIHDGHGTIQCSHGTIPVPVPAVMAMRENCPYRFVTDEVETEMVTPSGLGVLMGIGAEPVELPPAGQVLRTAVAKGGRDTGKEGLRISLIRQAGIGEEQEK